MRSRTGRQTSRSNALKQEAKDDAIPRIGQLELRFVACDVCATAFEFTVPSQAWAPAVQ